MYRVGQKLNKFTQPIVWKEDEIDIEKYATRKSFYGKAKARNDGDIAYLRSYDTIVARFNKATGEYKEKYFSATTTRHQEAFKRALNLI